MIRLRIRVTGWTRRTLILTDTPAPDCPDCAGDGGTEYDYGDHTGEYAGTEWEPCPCWTEWRMVLLPLPRLPRWLRRRDDGRDPWGPDGYSSEPPF
ncbi:hypothetical protein SAMN04487983_106244 [Streptomyces sp. yr375]|uniref:hypothetical protein n=1 Tax=Streptomyces sp. yr375 TaxID=1761906 RepID=UPI0008AEF364|nr:hypothetical protein [Streptomyces sp. yr375]SES47099.1 hypothetical protein SAMN04487983_106244 [Streptomyces sp. yr375]